MPVDDLGRRIDAAGAPLDDAGAPLLDPDGRPQPPATRTRVCTAAGTRYKIIVRTDGAWYRCCNGHVRKLQDCCTTSSRRINGDRGAARLLLRQAQGLLRHVLPDEGPMLIALASRRARRRHRGRLVAMRLLDGRHARARTATRSACGSRCSPARRSRSARSPGGVATFGGLALLGGALGAGQGGAVAIAVALLLAAAAGDIAGRRIVPQVRRQVPESWRRVLPVPLAAGLYGVLLGLGFTTFVLSFAVYALAAACLALGDPQAGLAVGLAFAAGRILPVVVLAPLQQTARGIDIAAGMAERPAVLRAIRAVGAVALGVAALVLALAGVPASAATTSVLTDRRHGSERGAGLDRVAAAGRRERAAPARRRSRPSRCPAPTRRWVPTRSCGARARRSSSPTASRWPSGCACRRPVPRSRRSPRAGCSGAPATRPATCCAQSTCRRSISRRSSCAAPSRRTASAARRSTATASCSTSAGAPPARSRRSSCRRGGARRCAPVATARSCSTPPSREGSCSMSDRLPTASRC